MEKKLHKLQKEASSHLSPNLRKQIGKRNAQARKGDEVRVLRGKYRGTVGKVERVDIKGCKVYIDGIKRRKVSGTEKSVVLHPSKIMITNIVLEDRERKESLERKK
jgi:large subunit ribosomal protein L24